MIKELDKLDLHFDQVIQDCMKFADWCWEHFDKPGNERDFDLDESVEQLKNYTSIVGTGIENACWSTAKDCGGRHYTTLLIRFATLSILASNLLQMDMDNVLVPVNPATNDSGDGYMEFVANIDGDDVFVCPFDLQYSDGWLTLELKVFRC